MVLGAALKTTASPLACPMSPNIFRSPAVHGAVISPARDEIRRGLRNYCLDVALPDEKFPLAGSFRRLLEALDTAEYAVGHGFAAELVAGVPHLRRSALSLKPRRHRERRPSCSTRFSRPGALNQLAARRCASKAWLFTICATGTATTGFRHGGRFPRTAARAGQDCRLADQQHRLTVQDVQGCATGSTGRGAGPRFPSPAGPGYSG